MVRVGEIGGGARTPPKARREEMAKHLRLVYSRPSRGKGPRLTLRGEPLDLDLAGMIGRLDKLLARRRRPGFLRLVVNKR